MRDNESPHTFVQWPHFVASSTAYLLSCSCIAGLCLEGKNEGNERSLFTPCASKMLLVAQAMDGLEVNKVVTHRVQESHQGELEVPKRGLTSFCLLHRMKGIGWRSQEPNRAHVVPVILTFEKSLSKIIVYKMM